MRHLLAPIVFGLAITAAGTAAAGADPCVTDALSFPAQVQTAVKDVAAAATALGVSADRFGDGKQSWVLLDKAGHINVVVTNPAGGAWLLRGVGGIDGRSACGAATVSVIATKPTIIRVQTDDAEPDLDCQSEFNYWDHFIIDESTGRIIARHAEFMGRSVGPDGPDVSVKAGRLKVRGDLTVDIALSALKACATPDGLAGAKAAMHWVKKGRKATAAGRYDDAIRLFHHATDIDDGVAEAHSGMGFALLKRNQSIDRMKAITAFETALKKKSDPRFQAAVYFNIGLANQGLAQPPTIPSSAKGYWHLSKTAFEKADSLKPSAAAKKGIAAAEKALTGQPASKPTDICAAKGYPQAPKAHKDLSTFMLGYIGPDAWTNEKAYCAGKDGLCGHGGYIASDSPDLEHSLAVKTTKGGLVVFDGAFPAWSGAGCGWDPTFSIESYGDILVVKQRGWSRSRENGECHDEGDAFAGVVVDRAAGRMLASFSCDGGEGDVLVEDGSVSYIDCKSEAHTGTIDALRACP